MIVRPRSAALALAAVALVAFAAGYRASRTRPGCATGARRVLYYVDPMNPSFRSTLPGTAPCGMPLEAVYADQVAASDGALPEGAVVVRPERQQLIGVTVEGVRRQTVHETVRLLGRVAVDETRLFRVAAGSQGWIRQIGAATTGGLVASGEVLAHAYVPELATLQQTFISTVQTYERVKKTGENPFDNLQGGTQLAAYEKNLRTLRLQLQNLGMSPEQVEDVARTGQVARMVELRAPAAGVVLARNVALGQRFEDGAELYTIADLRRVWVLAQLFESDARLIAPGTLATVVQPALGLRLRGRASRVAPQFDATTRRLELRLEADNPGLALRPEMYVDVEVPLELGAAIAVPAGAVLDSGTRQLVFVERSPGVFEPRTVTTGWRYPDRIEIRSGLSDGDRVVTSGNFLLDSESRMRLAAEAPAAAGDPPHGAPAEQAAVAKAKDPVCGMEVDPAQAAAAGLTTRRAGATVYFCSKGCQRSFDRDHALRAEARQP